MLKKLEEALKLLPELLDDPDKWDSLVINRRKPWTYRVFTFLPDGTRLCLHKFHECDVEEAFLHPHPWKAAFVILRGSYNMTLGRTQTRTQSLPDPVAKIVLTKGCRYEILEPMTWHNVIPTEETYTVMVNDTPWDSEYAHRSVRTTRGKDLDKMPREELIQHLAKFKELLPK